MFDEECTAQFGPHKEYEEEPVPKQEADSQEQKQESADTEEQVKNPHVDMEQKQESAHYEPIFKIEKVKRSSKP